MAAALLLLVPLPETRHTLGRSLTKYLEIASEAIRERNGIPGGRTDELLDADEWELAGGCRERGLQELMRQSHQPGQV